MTHESKHEIQMSAEQRITTLSALLATSSCLHPELPVTDETEQNYLTQLGAALTQGEFDDAAYGQLFTRLEADNLSLAALCRFANLCYQHWQRQWPTASGLQANQTEIARQTVQLQAMAQGRTLFRRSGTPTRYYWGRTNASGNDTTEKGLFFACYPAFAAQGETVKTIYHAELITDVAHIALCEAHTQAQRRQQSFSQLLQYSSLLHQRFLQQHGHHAKIVVDLQLAWLYYRSGHVVNSLSIHETGQAVFYFRQAMGQIARHTFIQQQPALPATLITAAEHVRERIDQAMLDHAQQTLFAAQSATLITRWQQCYQDAQLEVIYQLSQQTHALLTHAVSVPLAAKQPLIDVWLAGFNRGLAGEDEQEARVAMQSAVTRACNPVQKYPHSLATVHEWLLTLARQLQQHSENARARALLHAYQRLLIRRRPNLQSTIASTDQDKTPYIDVLATCEQALAELDQWLAISNLAAESKTAALHTILTSAFSARTQAIATWRETLAQSLAANTKASDIYTANTEFARNLLADICREIEQQIGPAPCAYTLLGAGSFSRGEISPASDLDCALLVADASVKTVDEDNSSKITFHPWFQCFLQLIQWKLASLPEGILSLESETLAWITKGYWFDTPEGLIEQHLASQQPNNPRSLQQPENFGAQWLRWIYSGGDQAQEKDTLFGDYQQRLQTFFHTPIGASSLPAYQQLAPWSLTQHVGQAVAPKPRALSLVPPQASAATKEAKETKETKESKHEVKASPSQVSAKITFTVLNVKHLSYRLINAILCYGRFNDVPAGMTTTREVLAYLKDHQCLSSAFITRLVIALDQLYTWRLRQHWAWLHHASELGENEVVLWPEDATAQAAITALPTEWRGFYLDKAETQQCQTILNTIAEAIGHSVEGFATYAKQLPIAAIDNSPSFLSSSVTTTTTIIPDVKETKETKEAKREVSEEEAQAILHASSVKKTVDITAIPTALSNAQLFNPIAVAMEWTLHQLADSKLPHATQTEHVTWLAHIMGNCATELPIGEPHTNDPTRVKQEPLFRKHWQVYWAIPTALRSTYIAQLRQSPGIDADAIIEPLRRAPNASGQRLRWLEEQERWQQKVLPQLWENKPIAGRSPTAISIARHAVLGDQKQWRVETYPLKSDIREQLFLPNGDWRPKDPTVSGNHRVYPIQINNQICFWVKAFPEQPASEFLVTELDRHLGAWGTPQMELVKFHHGGKTSAAVVTEAIRGISLRNVISDTPNQLEKLEFTSFMRTLWRVLLTNPEDDKDDDYFLVPQPNGFLHLVRIDNERAFFQPTNVGGKTLLFKSPETLQVKSVLYCLEQMRSFWQVDNLATAAAIDDCLQLQPIAVVSDLLTKAQMYHAAWNQLFSVQEVAAHFELQPPEVSIPAMCIPQGLAKELITRFTAIHSALRFSRDPRFKSAPITGLSLLKVTQPKLAAYYTKAHLTPADSKAGSERPNIDHRQVLPRFIQVVGKLYRKDAKGSFSSQMPGTLALQSSLRVQAPIDKPMLQAIREGKACSPKQELDQFLSWQQDQLTRLHHDLLERRASALAAFQGLPLRHQQLLWQEFKKPLLAKTLSQTQQAFLLQAMAGIPWTKLTLQLFDAIVVTEDMLQALLRGAGEHLLELDISGCTQLRPSIMGSIQRHCPHLQRLIMNNQPQWKSLIIGDFPALNHLEVNNARALAQLSFGQLPALTQLSLQQATALPMLADQGLGFLAAAAWRLPALQRLDIRGCQQLRLISLWVEKPEELIWRVVGCDQLQLPRLQSSQYVDYLASIATMKSTQLLLENPFKQQLMLVSPPKWFDQDSQEELARFDLLNTLFFDRWENTLSQNLRHTALLLAMNLYVHDTTKVAFTPAPAAPEAYAVWESVLKAGHSIKAASHIHHLPPLLQLNSDGAVYQAKYPFYCECLAAAAFVELLHAEPSFQAALLKCLNIRPIQTAPGVIAFLTKLANQRSERLQARYITFCRFLFGVVARSAREPELAQASSNAATLLNACQENLSHQSWAGVQLPGADLSYCFLAHSDLSNANLQGVNLMRTVLYQTNLQGANLHNVQWGEFPCLTLKEESTAIAWHPAKPRLAVAQGDGIVQLHSETGQPLGDPFIGHTAAVASVAYSPDGRHLASGGLDFTIRLWDVETGKSVGAPLIGHTDIVISIAYSPDGRRIASAGGKTYMHVDKTVRQWDAETGESIGSPLIGHTDAVVSVAYSPDGRRLVSGSYDHTIRQWDAETGRPIGPPLIGHTDVVTSIAYSPDGRCVASGSVDNTVRLWDAASGKPIGAPLIGHNSTVESVVYSPDGRRLVSGSWDKTLRQWDAETGAPIGASLPRQGNGRVVFSPDGRRIASVGGGNTVQLWDAELQAVLCTPLTGHPSRIFSVTYSPNGRRLASCSGKLQEYSKFIIQQWDTQHASLIGPPIVTHTEQVNSMAYSPDGRRLAFGSLHGEIQQWDAESCTLMSMPLMEHKGCTVTSIAYSPDGRCIASGSVDKTVRLWDAASGKPIGAPLTGHTEEVMNVVYSPDGRRIASAGGRGFERGADKTVRQWDAKTGRPIGPPLIGHTDGVANVAYSPDGRRLVSGSYDKTLRQWNAETGAPIGAPLSGHTDAVVSVAYSADGRRLVSGSSDKTVRQWDAESQRCLAVLCWQQSITSITLLEPPSTLDGNLIGEAKFSAASSALNSIKSRVTEDYLAVGDEAGNITFWVISTGHPETGFRLINMGKCSGMPQLVNFAHLAYCRMNASSRRLLEQYGADASQVIVDDTNMVSDSKGCLPVASHITGTSSPAFFQPVSRSQPAVTRESQHLVAERKGIPKNSKTQESLASVQALVDMVYPADNSSSAGLRASYLSRLFPFQQRAELSSEDLNALKAIETTLREEQAGLTGPLQPVG